MVAYLHTVVCLLILQYVSAAPSNITSSEELLTKEVETEEGKIVKPIELHEESKLDSTSSLNEEPKLDSTSSLDEEPKLDSTSSLNEEPKLDSPSLLIEESKIDDNTTQSFRQKRFYNFYHGAPPINPMVYSGYHKRDQASDTGVYGFVDDPLEHIQRRLQDIASYVRQPIPPPPPPLQFPPQYPFYLPVIYVPQYGCDCSFHNDDTTSQPPLYPPTPEPQKPLTPEPQTSRPKLNETDPDPDKRFPDLSDERQNWGLVTNESEADYDEEDYSRPISFDPIQPNRPNMRPAPPVDHGSSQGNSGGTTEATTTFRPTVPSRRPGTANQGRPSGGPGQSGRPTLGQSGRPAPYPSSSAPNVPRNDQPSVCDGAVLSCCHQAQVTYDCFVAQGCPDPTFYGNPCSPQVILQVVNKFQAYYGVRDRS